MIEPGDSGVTGTVLRAFLNSLSELDELSVFPGRFTLELRSRDGKHLLHVDREREIIRPVIPEDSRGTLVSLPRSRFIRLVEGGKVRNWRGDLGSGGIDVSR
jgi:gamma-glutamylcyclotransferase (GGCT)/AIG2-like uncharacterized protein YtfP